MRSRRSAYVLAAVAVAAALGLRGALTPWLDVRVPYVTLFGAVIVAAWYGGPRPALLAAVVGWLGAELFFVPPIGALTWRGPAMLLEILAYLLSTALIAGLAGAMHQARTRLEESEARFRSFMEHSPAFVYLKDEAGRYLFANEAGRTLLAPDWRGRTDAEMLPPQAAERVMANDRRVLEIDAPATFDLRMPGPDGELRLHSTKFPLRDAAGRRYVGVVTIDVTAQRRSEEQLQLVTDTMSSGMVRVSGELKYVWVNRVFAAWAGTTPQALVGRHIAEVIGAEGVEALKPYSDALRAGRRVEYERMAHFAGIGLRWIHSVAEPIFDAAGKPDGWVAVISDVHERRQAQEALRESDRRKDEFIAVLAHELRNPLAPIRNAVSLLAHERDLPPKLEWARAVIDRQVDQMARLIEDLLDIARITSGKLLMRPEPLTLGAVIDLALETSRPHIDAANQHLTLRLAAGEAWLDADRTRLAQVFSNLLNNAAKYTPRGGAIALATRREGADIVITVEDTGRGFPPEMAGRIFEPFTQWQADGQRSAGLGIGLALVRGIVELHGGRVEAQSAGPGKGSRFTVRLPAAHTAHAPRTAHAPPLSSGAGLRVLVADDNRDAADSLARILSAYGHEVRVAYDGRAALEECAHFEPHAAVLDVGMPEMDGYDVASALRARKARLQLIALTGWGQESDRSRALAAGFDHHLTKPAEPRSVHELIVKSCSV